MKRVPVIILLVVLITMSISSIVQAKTEYGFTYRHVPTAMPSTDAAFVFLKSNGISVDKSAIYIRNEEIPFNAIRALEIINPVDNGQAYPLIYITYVKQSNNHAIGFMVCNESIAFSSNVIVGNNYVDAIYTLALASGATLDPYCPYSLFLNDKAAKICKGSTSPADIMANDIITQVFYDEKNVPVTDFNTWTAAIKDAVAGKSDVFVAVKILRNNQILDRKVQIVNLNSGATIPQSQQQASPKIFGVMLRPLEPEEVTKLAPPNANGFWVIGVKNGSDAELMQIQLNDVLLAINDTDITSAHQLKELMDKGNIKSVKVFRAGTVTKLQLPLIF